MASNLVAQTSPKVIPMSAAVGRPVSSTKSELPPEPSRQSFISTTDMRRRIEVMADDISTWQEGAVRVFLLQGRAVISQNPLVIARMEQAILWVDEEGQKKSGVFNLRFFGEQLRLEQGGKAGWTARGVVDLATQEPISIKAYVSTIKPRDLSLSPLYKEAVRVATNAGAPAATPAGMSPKVIATPVSSSREGEP